MEEEVDYYSILQCDITSSKDVINKAARKLSLKYHPDKNPDPAASKLFQQIQEAKEFLLDEDKRKSYDSKISASLKRKAHDAEKLSKMGESRKRFKKNLELRLQVEKDSEDLDNHNRRSSDDVGGLKQQKQQQQQQRSSVYSSKKNKNKSNKFASQNKFDEEADEKEKSDSINDMPLKQRKSMMVDVMNTTSDNRPPLPSSYAEFIEKEANIFSRLGRHLNLERVTQTATNSS